MGHGFNSKPLNYQRVSNNSTPSRHPCLLLPNQTPKIGRMFSALLLCWFQLLVVSNKSLMVSGESQQKFCTQ